MKRPTINIKFSALGLPLEAEGVYYPGSPGTYYDPPDEAEFEFRSLTCDGQDAAFLLGGDLDIAERLEIAAIEAVEEESQKLREEIRAEYAFN